MANKKGRLNESERFYIEQNPEGLSVAELSRKMKREVSVINRYMIKLKQEGAPKRKRKTAEQVEVEPVVTVEPVIPTDSQEEETLLRKQFIRDSSKKRPYAVLSPSAAQMSDELVKQQRKNNTKMDQPHIFKPNPNEKSR